MDLCGKSLNGHADPDILIKFSYSYVLLTLIYEWVIMHNMVNKWSFLDSIIGVKKTTVLLTDISRRNFAFIGRHQTRSNQSHRSISVS